MQNYTNLEPLGQRPAVALRRCTRMFPGWRSPWTKLSTNTIFSKVCTPILAKVFPTSGGNPGRRYLVMGSLSSKVSTRMELVTNGRNGVGNFTESMSLKFSRKRSMFLASKRRSICLVMTLPNCSTISGRLSHLSPGRRCSSLLAALISSKSIST